MKEQVPAVNNTVNQWMAAAGWSSRVVRHHAARVEMFVREPHQELYSRLPKFAAVCERAANDPHARELLITPVRPSAAASLRDRRRFAFWECALRNVRDVRGVDATYLLTGQYLKMQHGSPCMYK